MSANMNDFLLEYYKRLIFRSMPIEQFVHFCEYVDKDDMDGHMKLWKEELLERDPADTSKYLKDAAGLYVRKDLPNPEIGEWALSTDEWEKLYKAFNNAFQAMDASKKSFKYEKKPNDFLKKYFGNDSQLFSYAIADSAAETKIAELRKILTDHEAGMYQMLKSYFTDDFSWKDLIDGIDSKKYNKDPKFRKTLTDIASEIAYDTWNPNSAVLSMVGRKLNFDAISKSFETSTINPAKMTQFKLVYSDLMKELYTNTGAFKYFSASDPTKISKSLNEAKEVIDYNNTESKDYISPKREDELTLPQRISEWWDNTYSNYLEKYVKLRPDRMFFSPYAKAIFKEIDKLKIKPTDGLDKIIENSSKISGELKKKYKKAPSHFDWFIKTLEELKSSMGKGKAFEKALQNGNLLNKVVQEIIVKAVRENKIDEAKTAMELLATMRYTLTSSKIMNAFSKSDLTIFSDKDLSWNKNEGVKFVTSAMDKGLKATLKLVGYTLTAAGNIINRTGTKFKGKVGDRIKGARDAKLAENEQKLDDIKTSISNYKAGKTTAKAHLSSLISSGYTYSKLKKNILTYTTDVDAKKIDFDSKLQDLEDYAMYNSLTDSDSALIDTAINSLKNDNLATIDPRILTGLTNPTLVTKLTDLLTTQSEYKTANTNLSNNQTKLQELITVRDDIVHYNSLIKKANEDVAQWEETHPDKFKELMLYWDMCNSPIMHSWFRGKEYQQSLFDKRKKSMFEDRLAHYTIR